jgi:uncharacterized OB-fold protein
MSEPRGAAVPGLSGAAEERGSAAREGAAAKSAPRRTGDTLSEPRGGGPGDRPLPVPDDVSAPYWAAAARHALAIACCARCGSLAIPPGQACPQCGSTDPEYTWQEVSGAGTVRSWTIIRQSFLPGFDADLPFLLVDVELAEQPELRMIGRLLDGPQAPVRIGAPVSAAFEDVADGISVPAFVLDEAPVSELASEPASTARPRVRPASASEEGS